MDAETAYVFRHTVLRDAAYQLQMPGERAKLHALALEICESMHAGDEAALDTIALDLADHARLAAEAPGAKQGSMPRRELAWLMRALEFADRSYRHEERLAVGLRVAQHPAADVHHQVKALFHVSKAQHRLGNMNAALKASQDAVERAARSADPCDMALAKTVLHSDLRNCGHEDEAWQALDEALALARAGNSGKILVDALLMHAQELLTRHRLEEAKRALDELEPLVERQATPAFQAKLRYMQCMFKMAVAGPNLSEALLDALQARQEIRRLGQLDVEAVMVFNIGVYHADRGLPAETKSWYLEALRLADEIGSRAFRAHLLSNLGNVSYYMESRYLEAIDYYERSLAQAVESGQLGLAQSILAGMGGLLVSLGRLDDAEAAFQGVKEYAVQLNTPEDIEGLKEHLADLCVERGDLEGAERFLLDCLRYARASNKTELISSTLKELAHLCWLDGRIGQADAALDESIRRATQVLWPTYATQSYAARGKLRLLLGDAGQAALDHAALAAIAEKSSMARVRTAGVTMPGFRMAAFEASANGKPPASETVARLQGLAAEYRQSGDIGDTHLYVAFKRTLAEVESVVAEVNRAHDAHEPAQLFNGTMPELLTPKLRRALIERLSATAPDQFSSLRSERPGVLARMLEGTGDLPLPDWRSTTLP